MTKNCWVELPRKDVDNMVTLIKLFDAEDVVVLNGGASNIDEICFTGNELTIKCVETFGFKVHILD